MNQPMHNTIREAAAEQRDMEFLGTYHCAALRLNHECSKLVEEMKKSLLTNYQRPV